MKQVADEADLLAEELGYESGDAFIVEYLKLDLDVVHQVISFLDQEQPTRDTVEKTACLLLFVTTTNFFCIAVWVGKGVNFLPPQLLHHEVREMDL